MKDENKNKEINISNLYYAEHNKTGQRFLVEGWNEIEADITLNNYNANNDCLPDDWTIRHVRVDDFNKPFDANYIITRFDSEF